METNFWASRYFVYVLYIGLTNVRLESVDCARMLVCHGYLWAMITMMVLFNEFSISCLVFCTVPWLIVQNWRIATDLVCYEKEPNYKTTFVRLIG